MRFEPFDPVAEYSVVWRHLPHWEQAGATYFITWRTADSLPRAVAEMWLTTRDQWLLQHNFQSDRRVDGFRPPSHLAAEYQAFVSEHWEAKLDECYGACVLREASLAKVVADSLLHFDGDRYAMGDFVVMPNHVHLLVCFPSEGQLRSQCRSWKKFTATEINKRLMRTGTFWQDESFDHVVRSPDEFERYRTYIAVNPTRARLRPGEYVYHRAEDNPVTPSCGPVTP